MKSYIGVTGFVSRDEIITALESVPKHHRRQLQIGVLASFKSLRGLSLSAVYAPRHPRRFELKSIFLDDPRCLNLIHYSGGEVDDETIVEDIRNLIDSVRHLNGFQLNMTWPDPGLIRSVLKYGGRKYRPMRIVLQVGRKSIVELEEQAKRDGIREEIRNDYVAMLLSKRLEAYEGIIDDVLLDQSGGLGKSMDVSGMEKFLSMINRRFGSKIGCGVAGGLSGDNLAKVFDLSRSYPHVSIDAESGVRLPDNSQIDPARLKSYLTGAFSTLT